MPKFAAVVPERVVILGATSAMAIATARLLAARGAKLFLVARSEEKLAVVTADLLVRGAGSVTGYVVDLDDTGLHDEMLRAAVQTLGSIDMALLAHGVLGDQAEAERSFAAAAAILHTNFISPVSLVSWLAGYFEAKGSGCIAVITSVAGDRARKSNYVYGTAKGALSLFLNGVRNRVDRAGVQVLDIRPGFVATPMTAHLPQGPLFAQPIAIGRGIVKAVETRRDIVYLPGFWRLIMFLVRAIPEPIFKNMNM